MAQRKSYFLARNFDNPPDGPVRLGNLITSPFEPEYSLITPRLPPSLIVHSTTHDNWHAEINSSSNNKVGLYAKFLDTIFGIGADASISRQKVTTDKYKFSRLETHFFIPSDEFVNDLMFHQDVKDFLVKKGFEENVYLITGIKIAYGANVTRSNLRGRKGVLKVGIDGTAMMSPIDAGPDISLSREGKEETGFESGDFVFAYRLREISYKKKVARSKAFEKGALFELERKVKEWKKEEVDETPADIEIVGISDDDVVAEDVNAKGEIAIDVDGEVCNCITATEENEDTDSD